MPEPRVLLDDDGDVWVSWDGDKFTYISRYGHHEYKNEFELIEDNDDLREAEWS